MESLLKVLAATGFLVTVVVVPIVLVSALLLYALAERGHEEKREDVITLVSYVKDGKRTTPTEEALIVCEETPGLCQRVASIVQKSGSCPESPRSVVVEGYFGSRTEVFSSCPEYKALLDAISKAQQSLS